MSKTKAKASAQPQATTAPIPQLPRPLFQSARIAIIGGGISGLVAAKKLADMGYHRTYIFDAATEPGGNSWTEKMMVPPYQRWADLGVNDYNKTTYTNIQKLIDELKVKTLPLEDTICYYTSDGTISYTAGPEGMTRPRRDMSDADWNKFLADITHFQENVYHISHDVHFRHMTVKDYIDQPHNPNNPKTAAYSYGRDFINLHLLPRINGMYFAQATGPLHMPIVLVTHYYILQEGFDASGKAPKPDRRYFVNGTRQFIEALQKCLLEDYDTHVPAGSDERKEDLAVGLTGKFILGHKAAVTFYNKRSVSWEGGPRLPVMFDRIIVATHANQAAECIKNAPPRPQKEDVRQTLLAFDYETSTAFVHHDKKAAPGNPEHWRTYNIHIYDYEHTPGGPYTITYVENRHQNDKENPVYQGKVDPVFFTTLNPVEALDSRLIYPQLDAPTLPARATFYHNVATMKTLDLQEELRKLQDKDALDGIFFAGGYTHGVGLHEECWHSGEEAARRAIDIYMPSRRQAYGSDVQAKGAMPADYAPEYIRQALSPR